jgi:hypothetical protein
MGAVIRMSSPYEVGLSSLKGAMMELPLIAIAVLVVSVVVLVLNVGGPG